MLFANLISEWRAGIASMEGDNVKARKVARASLILALVLLIATLLFMVIIAIDQYHVTHAFMP